MSLFLEASDNHTLRVPECHLGPLHTQHLLMKVLPKGQMGSFSIVTVLCFSRLSSRLY